MIEGTQLITLVEILIKDHCRVFQETHVLPTLADQHIKSMRGCQMVGKDTTQKQTKHVPFIVQVTRSTKF